MSSSSTHTIISAANIPSVDRRVDVLQLMNWLKRPSVCNSLEVWKKRKLLVTNQLKYYVNIE